MARRIVIGLFVGVFGAIFTAVGGWMMYDAYRFNAAAEHAEGVVVRLERRESRDRGRVSHTYVPVVRFEAEGRPVTFTGSVGSSPPAYKEGERVSVLYTPGNPEDARIESFWEQFGFPGIFLGISVILLLVGLGVLFVPVVSRRVRPRPPARSVTVKARVTAVRKEVVQADGRSFWLLLAEYHDGRLGKTHVFTSAPLATDPEPKHPVGSEVTVTYDPAQPTSYRLRLSG
jgi:hypothetical protein